jgi:hypothetical protein
MSRFAAIVIFAGAVLVSTFILAPAAPPAMRPAMTGAELAAQLDQTAPIVEQMNKQVDRLRERLAAPPKYPEPTRDPFRFGKPIEPAKKTATAPPSAPIGATAGESARPAPPLPRLVAITASVVSGSTTQTAVLAVGDDIQLCKVGDKIAQWIVKSIGADSLELADPTSGETFKISLQL